jgi:hypothetical protein
VIELADIFRTYGPAYRAKFSGKMPPQHLRAMRAIERCRTPALGGHVYTCPDCHETLYRYLRADNGSFPFLRQRIVSLKVVQNRQRIVSVSVG